MSAMSQEEVNRYFRVAVEVGSVLGFSEEQINEALIETCMDRHEFVAAELYWRKQENCQRAIEEAIREITT